MTIKKWKPFWSYDVEKTERWLSQMSADGNRLAGIHRVSRMFSFEEGARENVECRIIYDKSRCDLQRALKESGWETTLVEGDWKFITNKKEDIFAYPSREGVLKRNRVHANVFKVLAFLNAIPLLNMTTVFLLFLFGFAGNFVASPLWSLTALFALQGIATIVIAVYINRKLKSFEQTHFETETDVGTLVAGKTFAKIKLGWMYAPDLVEKWLSNMAAEGNHLVRVSGGRFYFIQGNAEKISYVYDFQLKAQPSYYAIHKSAGWQLKYTSAFGFLKFSIWAKSYSTGEEVPRLTYDKAERRAQVRKILLANGLYCGYSLAIFAYVIWMNLSIGYYDKSLYYQIVFAIVIAFSVIPIHLVVRTILYYRRMRNTL
jgi:hypothetical protein